MANVSNDSIPMRWRARAKGLPGAVLLGCAVWLATTPVQGALTLEVQGRTKELYTKEEIDSLGTGLLPQDPIVKAIFAMEQSEKDPDATPGMLVLSAGAGRSKATVYYPTENSSRFRSIEVWGTPLHKLEGLSLAATRAKEIVKRTWRAKASGERIASENFGSSRQFTGTGQDASADGSRVPREILVVKIPIGGRATVEVVSAFKAIEKRGDAKKTAGMGPEFRETVLKDFKELLLRATGHWHTSSATVEAETVLDWLYQSMLDIHLGLATGKPHGPNAKCTNAHDRRITRRNEGHLFGLYREDPDSEGEGSERKDSENEDFKREGERAARTFGSMHPNAVDPDVMELVMAGAFDPVILSILECRVRRDLFGPKDHNDIDNIILRSQYHRIATKILNDARGPAPHFFTAVHLVTSSVGVGYVDLDPSVQGIEWRRRVRSPDEETKQKEKGIVTKGIEKIREGGERIATGAVRRLVRLSSQNVLFENVPAMKFEKCADPGIQKKCLVCEAVREINRVLFMHNRNVMHRLARGKPDRWFDPLGHGVPIRNRLEFDTRMVLMEQAIVEHLMAQMRKTTESKTTACVEKQLSMLADSVQKMKPKPGIVHRHWSGYTAGLLVQELQESNNQNIFARFSESGHYVFKPHFANHWWRVAIGVAYVLVLHEAQRQKFEPSDGALVEKAGDQTDRVPERLRKEYLRRLERILEEAPREGLGKNAQETLEALTRTKGMEEAEEEAQTARLAQALEVLRPSDQPRTWQGCNPDTLEVTRREAPRHDRWSRILRALAHETHETTLADAFESAGVTGHTKLPDRLPASAHTGVYRDVCRTIQRRKDRTLCLLAGRRWCKDDEAMKRRREGSYAVLLDYESATARALRMELPATWPFLVEAIEEAARSPEDAPPEQLAAEAVSRRARWERDVAQAQRLGKAPASALKALKLEPPDVYRTLADEARGVPVGETEGTPAWMAKADAALAPGASLERVRTYREKLNRMRRDVRRAHAANTPMAYPAPKLPRDREARSSATANGVKDALPGVAFHLIRTQGRSPDGRPIHRAIGMFEGRADGPDRELRPGLPLGLEVRNVVVEPDGSLRALDDGRMNASVREPAARALLSSFGVPELFSEADVTYTDLGPDFTSLTMKVTPKLRGYALAPFELVLLEGGAKRQDIAEQLGAGLEQSVQGAAGATLRKLLEPLGFEATILKTASETEPETKTSVKIAFGLCEDEDPEVGLEGNELPETGAPPPIRVIVKPAVCLGLHAVEGNQREALIKPLRARPKVVLDAKGLHVETMGIQKQKELDKVADALQEALEPKKKVCEVIGLDQCPVEDVKIQLTAGTETVGQGARNATHAFSIGIDATYRLPLGLDKEDEQCLATLRVAVPLANASNIMTALATQAENAVKGAAEIVRTCVGTYAAAKGAKSASEWVEKHKTGIDILGVRWELDCDDDASQCIRSEGMSKVLINIKATIDETKYRVRGLSIEIKNSTVRIGLRNLEPESEGTLAQALVAQVTAVADSIFGKGFVGKDLDGKKGLEIDNEVVGELENGNLYFYANLTLRGLPYLEDVALGRTNFANVNDPEELKQLLFTWVANGMATKLGEAIAGDVQIPYVGTLTLKNDAVEIRTASTTHAAQLNLTGTLSICCDVEATMTIGVPIPALKPVEFEADPEGTQAVIGVVTDKLIGLVPFAGDKFKVENPRFAEIEPGTKRYGLLMGAKVSFDPFITLEAKKIVVSIDGLQLAGALKGRSPAVVELASVALSRIGGTYYPGHDGTRPGLTLEADIAPGTSAAAKLVKMDTTLDLREIASLRFELNGDLVVLDSVPILQVDGVVDLQKGAVRVAATTPELLEKVLAAKSAAWMGRVDPDGGDDTDAEPSFGVRSRLSVLGAEIANTVVRADLEGEGRIKAHAGFTIPLGPSAHADYESELDFEEASLEAGMSIALLNWEAISAQIAANPDWASARLKVLLFDVSLGAPSLDRIDRWTAAQALRGLFSMSLSDLSKINPAAKGASIEKVTVGKDGSTRAEKVTTHGKASKAPPRRDRSKEKQRAMQKEQERSARGSGDTGQVARTKKKETKKEAERDEPVPNPVKQEQEEREVQDGAFPPVKMMDMGFGTSQATLVYCHRVGDGRYLRVADTRTPPNAKDFEPDVVTTRGLRAQAFRWSPERQSQGPCVDTREWEEGDNWLWQREWVPLGTRNGSWRTEGCDIRTARPWLDVRTTQGTMPDSAQAQPVEATLACWEGGARATVSLHRHRDTKVVEALIGCPEFDTVPETVKNYEWFEALCGHDAPSFVSIEGIDPSEVEQGGRFGNLVGPKTAYELYERVRAVAFDQEHEPVTGRLGEDLKMTLYPEANPAGGLTVLMEHTQSGALVGVAQIEDETVRGHVVREAEAGEPGTGAWTRTLLEPWWEEVRSVGGARHPNRSRPRTISPAGDGGIGHGSVLVWTLGEGVRRPDIENMQWSWELDTDPGEIETRRVEVETSPSALRHAPGLVELFARNLPRLQHKGKTHVITTRDEDRYGLEFLAYLPPDGNGNGNGNGDGDGDGDGDAKIVFAPQHAEIGNAAKKQWTAGEIEERERHAVCAKVSEIEEIIEDAHTQSTDESTTIDIREWVRNPGETTVKLALGHDPVDALAHSELKCEIAGQN